MVFFHLSGFDPWKESTAGLADLLQQEDTPSPLIPPHSFSLPQNAGFGNFPAGPPVTNPHMGVANSTWLPQVPENPADIYQQISHNNFQTDPTQNVSCGVVL